MGERSRTVVVVVNYKTPTRVVAMLESMAKAGPLPRGVVIIDNASGDGSPELLREFVRRRGACSWAHVRSLDANIGFAGGVNTGVRYARATWPDADLYYLLNPDTLLRPGAISALEHVMGARPAIGIAGSQVESPSGGLACSGHVGDGPSWQFASAARMGFVDRALHPGFQRIVGGTEPHRCDWVSGAALMIRKEVLAQVGPLDDGFFLYFEEVDLCRRARRTGWEVWLVPDSRIVHDEGASTGIRTGRLPAYWFDSRRRFFLKHMGISGLLAADVAWLVGRSARLAVDVVRRSRSAGVPPRFDRDLVLGDLAAVVRGETHAR